jgi:hypothetical protein
MVFTILSISESSTSRDGSGFEFPKTRSFVVFCITSPQHIRGHIAGGEYVLRFSESLTLNFLVAARGVYMNGKSGSNP